MRFFKYLAYFLLLIFPVSAIAEQCYQVGTTKFKTPETACASFWASYPNGSNKQYYFDTTGAYAGKLRCYVFNEGNNNTTYPIVECDIECGEPGTPIHVSFENMEHIPLTTCYPQSDGRFCVTQGNPATVSGGGTYLGQTFKPSIIHQSVSKTPSLNCTPKFSDTKCDNKDPYGGCYVPPDDGCTRQADGSIYCPSNVPPPTPTDTCSGATYCKRPPEGCGTGYVSGSFNGQQLCVKSGPSTPPDPSDPTDPQPPNQCTAQYCPKPEPEKECPTGYYSSYYNGTPICVANNPNPNQPNQNDPNNNENASSEPIGGDDPNTSFDVKGIIDAIKALRDSLLGSIENVSKKLTTLIDGQKITNDHLTKLNEKSQIANEHLQNIEDSSLATSEAVGESNKKLDQIFSDQGKQEIEQLGEQSTDSRLTAAESEMTSKLQTLANTLSYSSSHACISDFTITDIPYFGSTTVPFSKYCDLLALIKLLLKLATLMYALRMIDATVRVF